MIGGAILLAAGLWYSHRGKGDAKGDAPKPQPHPETEKLRRVCDTTDYNNPRSDIGVDTVASDGLQQNAAGVDVKRHRQPLKNSFDEEADEAWVDSTGLPIPEVQRRLVKDAHDYRDESEEAWESRFTTNRQRQSTWVPKPQ